MTFSELKSLLFKQPEVFIITHKNPDGDAMGSALGLANLLKKIECEVSVVAPSEYPEFLNWMESNNEVLVWGKNNEQITYKLNRAHLVFCLDFNALHRIEEMESLIENSRAIKVMIDHHIDPQGFADFILSDTSASSTCELVYQFIVALGLKSNIDQGVAEALYCGIMTDTGSFRYPSTSPKTHRIAADLIEHGADKNKIHQLVYDSNTVNRLHLLGYCLNNFEVINEQFALFTLNKEQHHNFNVQKGDTEGIVNYGLSIQKVVISAFFREDDDKIKISFRSKNDWDVNQFARKYFNGGGHKNAAGGMYKGSLEDAVKHFKIALSEI